ncbi:MAG: hypothetical protein AAFZ01_08080, partial [Pseudomonadota bacterium]
MIDLRRTIAGVSLSAILVGAMAPGALAQDTLLSSTTNVPQTSSSSHVGAPAAVKPKPVVVASRVTETQAKPAFASWFRYRESVTENWYVQEVEDDANKVLIRIRGNETPEGVKVEPRYRVVVLYPRPSSAYDTAISTILTMFAERDIQAEVTVINFQRKDELGKEAIAVAERENADLIYAMGSQSTAWLWKNYRGGKIPVISVTSKDPVILGQTD